MSRWDHWTENGGLLAHEAFHLIILFIYLFPWGYFLFFDIISIGKRDFEGKKLFNARKIDIFGGFRIDLPEVGMEDMKIFPDLQNMFHDG